MSANDAARSSAPDAVGRVEATLPSNAPLTVPLVEQEHVNMAASICAAAGPDTNLLHLCMASPHYWHCIQSLSSDACAVMDMRIINTQAKIDHSALPPAAKKLAVGAALASLLCLLHYAHDNLTELADLLSRK
jgi:hypothetical protein